MTLFSRWVELIITQDSLRFAAVTELLKANGIAYKEEIQNIGHGNRQHGQLGALGENSNYTNLYQLFVKRCDLERAKALLAQHG